MLFISIETHIGQALPRGSHRLLANAAWHTIRLKILREHRKLRAGFIFAVILIGAIGLAGCASAPTTTTKSLDPRLAWPCERLVVTWSVDTEKLQSDGGEDLALQSNNTKSKVRLEIMRCDAPDASSHSNPLLFAYVTVPVTSDSAPLVITSIPTDGWSSLLHLVADTHTGELFNQMGFEVLAGNLSFVVKRSHLDTLFEAKIVFDKGRIVAAGSTTGGSTPHATSRALIVRDDNFLTAFFGQERADRFRSVAATIWMEGETPLSQFHSSQTPATATFDSSLTSDRIFWRLPIAQQ